MTLNGGKRGILADSRQIPSFPLLEAAKEKGKRSSRVKLSTISNALLSNLFVELELEDYSAVLNYLNFLRVAGKAPLWPRAEFVQPNQTGYFKPDTAIYSETSRKDRRNGKEFKYIHATGSWTEQALVFLNLAEQERDAARQGRPLAVARLSLEGAKVNK